MQHAPQLFLPFCLLHCTPTVHGQLVGARLNLNISTIIVTLVFFQHPVLSGLGGIQITVWGRGELEAEVEKGLWRPAVASKMALLRTRDRKGPDIAKPMVRQDPPSLFCAPAPAAPSQRCPGLITSDCVNELFGPLVTEDKEIIG